MIDNSGLRRESAAIERREAVERYKVGTRAKSTSPTSPPAKSLACEQAVRSYDLQQRSLKRDPGRIRAKREAMHALCGTPLVVGPTKSAKPSMSQPAAPQNLHDPHTGKIMPRTGSGYTDPATGTFYQGVAGGVVNTRTGRFIPTN
ncbi:MAG: hypothetical protein U5S82_13675 [Gammaproteobacteria bacterium]|nr:hypothetical protein [Gammaproteobacteria bacterium]